MFTRAPLIFSLSFRGRFGRLNYINAVMLCFLLFCAAFIAVFFLVEEIEQINLSTREGKILGGLIGLALIFSVRAKALRLHDLELSGLLAPVLVLISIAIVILETAYTNMSIFGIAAILMEEILFMSIPGNTGNNHYGPETQEGSRTGLVMLGMLVLIAVGIGVWTQIQW